MPVVTAPKKKQEPPQMDENTKRSVYEKGLHPDAEVSGELLERFAENRRAFEEEFGIVPKRNLALTFDTL